MTRLPLQGVSAGHLIPRSNSRSIAERPWGLASWAVVDGLSNAIERAKRAQQSFHYYRKWNYIKQENLVVTRPSVRPYVSPPLDVNVSRNEISHWRTHAYGLLEGKKKSNNKNKAKSFIN